MKARVPARIFGIVAQQAPIAVIFRRGPSRSCQMLTWNLESDEVTPGQWIYGKVFVRRCDLSPDGQLLVAAISNYAASRTEAAALEFGLPNYATSFWTAVSRPPYFTALALWFLGPSYNGGGMWIDNRTLGFNNQPYADDVAKPMPRGFRRVDLNLGPGEDRGIWNRLLTTRGWLGEKTSMFKKSELSTGTILKPFSGGMIRYRETTVRSQWLWKDRETWELLDADNRVVWSSADQPMGWTWVDVDHRGRVLLADGGRLFVWEDFPAGEPRLIIDLNDNTFSECPPPDWALHWP